MQLLSIEIVPFWAIADSIRGDRVIIDASTCELRVELSDQELAARRTAWRGPAPKATSGVLGKYVRLVRSASEGCVTDEAETGGL